ncbi:helix-turn-helix transcriptional regulator [Candidatus Bathyarchaeota archaeon]|nr:helix-turn-helix transcriptional regulator [Candidatus Bathyarchaeota archaeon]
MPLNRSLESSFGLVLRRLRQNCGFSQEKLGFESGYHRTYISLLERGQKSPSLQTIFKLAKALDVEPSEIVEHVQAVTKPRSRKKR